VRISVGKLIGSLLLLGLIAFFLWIYNQFEYVEKTIPSDFRGAAATNPLLAAGRLAERYGATAHFVPAYNKPPPSGAMLVFTAPRYWLDQRKNDALLEWVEKKGGHLIVSLHPSQSRSKNSRATRKSSEESFKDPLLGYLGISTHSFERDDEEEDEDQTTAMQNLLERFGRDDDEDQPTAIENLLQRTAKTPQAIELPDGTHLKAQFDPQLRLFEDPDEGKLGTGSDWRVSEPGRNKGEGHHGLSYKVGSGRITILTNLDFISNDKIGDEDHAALFVYLASLAKGQDIWFAYGNDVPALWRWLVDYAWVVLIAAFLLLVTWLWAISRRFGPLLPVRSVARRSIVEHVAASARYLWRSGQGSVLYQALCDEFYKRAYLRYPQWARLPEQELYQQVALFAHETRAPQLSGLNEHAVENLLNTSHPRDESQFAAHSHLLDILRNKL